MSNLKRRIEVLERSRSVDRCRVRNRITRQALEHLSMDELDCLVAIGSDLEQGSTSRELSVPELAAVEALNVAMELECKQAGFSSLAEFEHSYSATRLK